MMVHVSLRRTHIALAQPICQRLTVGINHHAYRLFADGAEAGDIIYFVASPLATIRSSFSLTPLSLNNLAS